MKFGEVRLLLFVVAGRRKKFTRIHKVYFCEGKRHSTRDYKTSPALKPQRLHHYYLFAFAGSFGPLPPLLPHSLAFGNVL